MYGEIFILTTMRRIPSWCSECKYYDTMGGMKGRGNDGACTAGGSLRSTAMIHPSRERLPDCPLVKLQGIRKEQITERARKDGKD